MYETATKVEPVPPPKKRFEQNRGDFEEWDSSRDGSSRSGSPPPSTGKRKMCSDREPESPTDLDPHQPTPPYAKREKSMYPRERMETDSPSSYPRHVLVPSDEHHDQRQTQIGGAHPESTPSRKAHADSTPTLTPESVSMTSGGGGGNNAGFEPHYYRPAYYGSEPYHNGGRGNPNFPPESELGHYGRGSGQSDNVYLRPSPKRWACDYCNVATFLSYEEACAHEEACARRHQDHYARLNPRPPMRSFGEGNGNGLASLYHAAQQDRWNARAGPPMPMLPSEKGYRMQQQQPPHPGYGDYRGRYEMDEYGYHQPPHQPHQREPEQRRGMLLSLSTDTDSLSDRQCYVRTTMVEIFAASEKDVAARHTKGAQKLAVGQVGIRCVCCSHLRPRDRAERAVCYPSSISRIYQTVADMQRFHFEQCTEIPSEVRDIYKSLKTTRPRGVGSPQTYWVQSAKILGLADSDNGIRFQDSSENSNNANKQQTDMSV